MVSMNSSRVPSLHSLLKISRTLPVFTLNSADSNPKDSTHAHRRYHVKNIISIHILLNFAQKKRPETETVKAWGNN